MLFKMGAYGDERGYMSIKNVSGSTITTGLGVAIATLAASFDGTQAVIANATTGSGFIGIAYKDIPANVVANMQMYGAVGSVLISNVGSSLTINNGDPLVPAGGGFFSGAPTYANSGFKYIIASSVPGGVSAQGYVSGYIRGAM
jgi:hypothetical protein